MGSLVNNESIRLFEKLPLLPLCEISKHLNACAIVLAAAYSQKWEKLMRKRRSKTVWDIRIVEDELNFAIMFPDTTQTFVLSFKVDSIKESVRMFSKKVQIHCFNTLRMLSLFFPPTSLRRIYMILGSTSPDFPFRFLSRLPRGTAEYVHLQANLEVNSADLIKFLENVQVNYRDKWSLENRLNIQVRTKNLVTSDKIRLEHNCLYIQDARFLTRKSTPKLGAFLVQIGMNNFTSQDFNAFLKSWMADGRQNRSGSSFCSIYIREDQNIKLEEVMEGLNVHGQRTGDRWMFHLPIGDEKRALLNPIVIKMNKCLDITDSQGQLGTVLLEPNRFIFVTCEVTWEVYENKLRTLINKCADEMLKKRRTMERLERWNASRKGIRSAEDQAKMRASFLERPEDGGTSRCRPIPDMYRKRMEQRELENLSEMSECQEKIQQLKQDLSEIFEVYHKLIIEWNN